MSRLHSLETNPDWACLLTNVGRFSLTTPQHTLTCATHSHLLDGIALSGSRLTTFTPMHSDVWEPPIRRWVLLSPVHFGDRS